ncbi:hypothetical protein JZU71_02155, partial [bacterium]|nr:hypothetical protein [bacterium]
MKDDSSSFFLPLLLPSPGIPLQPTINLWKMNLLVVMAAKNSPYLLENINKMRISCSSALKALLPHQIMPTYDALWGGSSGTMQSDAHFKSEGAHMQLIQEQAKALRLWQTSSFVNNQLSALGSLYSGRNFWQQTLLILGLALFVFQLNVTVLYVALAWKFSGCIRTESD